VETCVHNEIEAIKHHGVYEEVDLPIGHKALENRWVFDKKSDGQYKACLVVEGFSQIKGIDFDKIFSPVVHYETVCLILALSALEDWHITGLDVKNTFLCGELDEEIYMKRPEGYHIKGQGHCVWRLLKALYGLKQAALVWWKALSQSMKVLGYTCLTTDAGVFVCHPEL